MTYFCIRGFKNVDVDVINRMHPESNIAYNYYDDRKMQAQSDLEKPPKDERNTQGLIWRASLLFKH
jgi:hypothetical protein